MATEERDHDDDSIEQGASSDGEARLRKELFSGPRVATFDDHLEQLDAMADANRFVVLYLLYKDGDTTYKKLSDATGKVGNGLNHHLSTLQSAGLINQYKRRVDGQERSVYELSVLGRKLLEPMVEFIAEEGEIAEHYT
jgi:DNA-binding HxlR family transcriptional regulator